MDVSTRLQWNVVHMDVSTRHRSIPSRTSLSETPNGLRVFISPLSSQPVSLVCPRLRRWGHNIAVAWCYGGQVYKYGTLTFKCPSSSDIVMRCFCRVYDTGLHYAFTRPRPLLCGLGCSTKKHSSTQRFLCSVKKKKKKSFSFLSSWCDSVL